MTIEVKSTILKRQLEKSSREDGSYDFPLLIALVDSAFEDAEKERRMSHRALQLMSNELLESNQDLRRQAEELKASKERLSEATSQLTTAARYAGMAEVSTNVLHNIGNILNSVNTTTTLLSESVKTSKLQKLRLIKALLLDHKDNLAEFLTQDPKGQLLPQYILELCDYWEQKRDHFAKELDFLSRNVTHIKDCVTMQQDMAKAVGMIEAVNLSEMIDSVLYLQGLQGTPQHIKILKSYEEFPTIFLDRIRLNQILVNLVQNAKQAVTRSTHEDKIISIVTKKSNNSELIIEIKDNGIGISPTNLKKIFSHGFTTKKDGHGFGLHYCANAAKEMGGSIKVDSAGEGYGATFTLTIPYRSSQFLGDVDV